jgi:predicted anti-sigma-YlaC factor YlaD
MLSRQRFLEWLREIYATADFEIPCEQAQLLLPAYVETELAQTGLSDQLAQVRDHLAHCHDCQDEYMALRQVAELEARGALPTVEALLEQLGHGVAARSQTYPVPPGA